MEQLSLLQKIYLYGETLSSEELNQIVLYLNSSIEAINTLIARNNNINEGHCEMRYKVSAQLPEAPESGTDGKSNGWSDTYTKPDTANGEITWMTLSFFNGEGVYGSWSTPVCITWGSVQGQKGPKGESGLKGSFKSRVFKRLNTRPDTPTGGTYDSPIPSSGGWTDGIPAGKAIIWSSVCTFYGNGLSSGWSIPAPESDSDTLDIEFSPSAVQPEPPTGNIPFSNHESESWYDPSSNNFDNVGTMIWRAERKVSNGEYNGEWTITRIVGERGPKGESGLTGGHYEFRYNNFKPSTQASAPTKPSDGSNGTTGGWTTSQLTLTETLIKDGYATWMTQCYQNENSTYGVWSDPIRITGANGYDGADGNEVEFVYTRRNTAWENPTPPPTTQQEDWTGTVDGVTWTDNPLGVLEDLMYEYVSLRAKINDVWSAYSTPVIWSKWGEKGMDGDGYEYIYKRFTTTITWADANTDSSGSTLGKNDNPANWSTSASGYLNKEYIYSNSGWSDDPVGINETYKYEYVSTREYRLWPNETEKRWGAFSTPTLWSGIPGGKEEFRYANTNSTSAPTKPSAGSSGLDNTWSATLTTLTDTQIKNGYKTYMTHCFKTDTGTYGTWSDPVRITGKDGLDGEDGSDIEFIYTRNNDGNTPTAPTASGTGNTKTFSGDDWFGLDNNGVTWTDNPAGVEPTIKYEYVAVREKPAGKNQSWGEYHVALWSKWGEKGMDGDGYEYIYKHFSTEQTWGANDNNPNNWAANSNREYYGPSGYEWSDDPTGVDSTNKYEYVSVRQRVDGTWQKFSTPVLWSNYAEPGATVQGPQGKLGPMSYLAGIWDATKTYTKTETMNPIVYYTPNDSYYYLVGTPPVSALGNNDNPTTSNKWAQAENYNTVFTDILFVNTFAKLGSFIVNEDWIISRYGIVYDYGTGAHPIQSDSDSVSPSASVTYNYLNAYTIFDSAYPNRNKPNTWNFVPSLAIDAKTGESYFNKAHITGEVTANSGTFTGVVNATGGTFKGNVLATQFIAGDPGGLNITTTGDAISFNYGGDRRAWFTTKDESDNDTNGMFLYVKGPGGELITIDFAGLKFKNANVSGSAVQLRNFYRNVTDSSYASSIFINTADGKYYNDSQLLSNAKMSTTSGYYYEKMAEGHVLVSENGYNIIYPASFFNKVSFNDGDKVVADSNYWVTTTINGRIKELRGTTSAGTFYDYNTYLETTSNLISLNSYLDLNGNSIYSAFTGTAGGGYISNLIFVSRTNGATIVGERVYTIHS